MFIASAAKDTLQGKAIHAVNERWGADFRSWNGRETIGIPVCKKKYAPFNFYTKKLENGQIKTSVCRMYGCAIHSDLRKRVIRQVGERKGWETFGQWSMKKAQSVARKVTEKINNSRESSSSSEGPKLIESSSSSEDDTCSASSIRRDSSWTQLCNNGKCRWKMKGKYDDIHSEIIDREEDGDT
jgi:hypothetical protein